ncbi:MAG: DNA cytosine methyltransferase, partial [Bacteroidota bacterium]
FKFPKPTTITNKVTLKQTIQDLKNNVLPAKKGNFSNDKCLISNHEYMLGDFSSMYMSRNRVRTWDEVSFTIQAGGRHAPLHPQAPIMKFIEQNKREFVKGKESLYRRLSVRECARIQTFPDDFIFYYKNISAGYKMIGNAVPVELGKAIAIKIKADLDKIKIIKDENKQIDNQRNTILNGQTIKERMLKIVNSES